MRYLCDNRRHLICEPFSIAGLHAMADALGLHRCWYHPGKFPHYDIPKRRIFEIAARCTRVSAREILRIIKQSEGNDGTQMDRVNARARRDDVRALLHNQS